jgi:hypothetical protein
VFYDSINDFGLKQCLKEKIGKFMERKERNAEGKTSALPNTKLYFSYVLQNFHKKSIHIKCYYLQKRTQK